MLGKKKYLASELIEEQAVVFLLIEEENIFTQQLVAFFQDCGLEARPLLLNSFIDANQALKQYQLVKEVEVYRFLVVGGFKDNFLEKPEFLIQVLRALERAFVEEGRVLPLSFLLNYSSSLSPINIELSNYQLFWSRQKLFLNSVLKNFPLAQICLLEDYLDLEFDFNLKFNLFFSLFKEHLLIDAQTDCFWQSRAVFLANFRKIFFHGKPGEKFLLRGKKTQSTDFLTTASDLCSRYFLEDFSLVKIFLKANDEQVQLADFVKIYQSDALVTKILDQKIRQLPLSLNESLSLNKKALASLQGQKNRGGTLTPAVGEKESKEPEKAVSNSSEIEEGQTQAATNPKQELLETHAEENVKTNLKEDGKEKKQPQRTKYDGKTDVSSDIDKKLQQIFRSQQQERRAQRFDKNLQGARKIVKKSKYRRVSFYFGVLLASVGTLVLVLFLSFLITQKIFVENLMSVFRYGVENKRSTQVSDEFRKSYPFFEWQLKNYQKITGEEFLSTANSYWQIFAQIIQVQELAKATEEQAYNLYQETLATDSNPEAEWLNFLAKKKELYQVKQQLSQYLEQLNPEILPTEQAESLNAYKTQLNQEIRVEQRTLKLLEALSQYLLSPARSNIAILIQDSNELRSSGGFLSSLVVLSFESGHLLNWQVYDIEELDRRVYGDKAIDEELKSVLIADKLLFRDANWPADFTKAGEDIAWFIKQSLSLNPDLILSLNSKELNALSASLYPIEINGFELQKNNFYEELLRQKNFNFNDLTKEFFNRLTKLSLAQMTDVCHQLLLALESREALMYSPDEALLAILKNNLWSGEILQTPCPSEFATNETCFTDGIYQLENNVGLNKVNRLITERIDHSIGISENFIRHKRTVVFTNNSRQNFWPEGNYQAYIKFYIPETARLEKITVDGTNVDRGAYRWIIEGDKRVLAYRLLVPVLSSSTLEIVYLVPHQLVTPFSYVFLDQKQAGIFDKQSNYKVLFAEQFQPNLIAPQANYENKVIEFNNNNQDNFLFAVAF